MEVRVQNWLCAGGCQVKYVWATGGVWHGRPHLKGEEVDWNDALILEKADALKSEGTIITMEEKKKGGDK